jgi:aspartate-semialdehyde dehydrogenase
VVVSTYQAPSGAGLAGTRDLLGGTESLLAGRPYQQECFPHPIAFNCIPQIGSAKYQGYTSEEMKMVYETRKMLEDDSLQICATCVRVPVGNCHSESILVDTERKIGAEEARRLWAATPGLVVMDDLDQKLYPMPINCDKRDETFIGRVREDISSTNGLAFWCVSDNLRKGAATNAVQIAELLVKDMVRS